MTQEVATKRSANRNHPFCEQIQVPRSIGQYKARYDELQERIFEFPSLNETGGISNIYFTMRQRRFFKISRYYYWYKMNVGKETGPRNPLSVKNVHEE